MASHYFNVKVSFALCPKLISLSLKTVLPVGSLPISFVAAPFFLLTKQNPLGSYLIPLTLSRSTPVCVLFTQSCPILCHPWTVAHQAPGSFVHGFLQARILEWVAISFSTFHTYLNRKYCCLCFKLYPESKCFPSSMASSLVPATWVWRSLSIALLAHRFSPGYGAAFP